MRRALNAEAWRIQPSAFSGDEKGMIMPSKHNKSRIVWSVFYLSFAAALIAAAGAPVTFRPIPLCDYVPFVMNALDQACSLYGTSTTAKAAAHWGSITVAQERVLSVFILYALTAIGFGLPRNQYATTHLWFDDLGDRQFVLRWNDIDAHPRYKAPRPWIIVFWTVAGFLFGFLAILSMAQALVCAVLGGAIGVLASLNVGRPRLHRRGIAITYDGTVTPIGPPIKGAPQHSIALDAVTGVETGQKKDWIGSPKSWWTNVVYHAYEAHQTMVYAMGTWGTPVFFSESKWDRSAYLPIQTSILRMVEMMKPLTAEYQAKAESIGMNTQAKAELDAWMTGKIQEWIDREIHRKKPAQRQAPPVRPARAAELPVQLPPMPSLAQSAPHNRPPLELREAEVPPRAGSTVGASSTPPPSPPTFDRGAASREAETPPPIKRRPRRKRTKRTPDAIRQAVPYKPRTTTPKPPPNLSWWSTRKPK